MSERVHWSMEPDADKLDVRVVNRGTAKDIGCLCGVGKRYVEGGWPIHGWTFHAGQCCDCLNIRVYDNGAEPADFKSGDKKRIDFADENSDEIHVCDLDAFIHALTEIKKATEASE